MCYTYVNISAQTTTSRSVLHYAFTGAFIQLQNEKETRENIRMQQIKNHIFYLNRSVSGFILLLSEVRMSNVKQTLGICRH